MGILISDTFNRTVASGAGTADGGTDSAKTWTTVQGVDANVNCNGSVLVNTSDAEGWGGKIGTATTENVDMVAEVANFGAASVVFKHFTLKPRYTTNSDTYLVRWNNDQDATDNGALEIMKVVGGVVTRIGLLGSQTRLSAFSLRAQCDTIGDTVVLRLKWWTGSEPGTWNLTATDSGSDRILSGVFAMEMYNAGSGSDLTVDNFVVQRIQQATIGGTATASIDESNIVAGGKTITITLAGATFRP